MHCYRKPKLENYYENKKVEAQSTNDVTLLVSMHSKNNVYFMHNHIAVEVALHTVPEASEIAQTAEYYKLTKILSLFQIPTKRWRISHGNRALLRPSFGHGNSSNILLIINKLYQLNTCGGFASDFKLLEQGMSMSLITKVTIRFMVSVSVSSRRFWSSTFDRYRHIQNRTNFA